MDSGTPPPLQTRTSELAAYLATLDPNDHTGNATRVLQFLERQAEEDRAGPEATYRLSKTSIQRPLELGRTFEIALPREAEPLSFAYAPPTPLQIYYRYPAHGLDERPSRPTHFVKTVCTGGPLITERDKFLGTLLHNGAVVHIYVGPATR